MIVDKKKNYITPKGFQKLASELDHLLLVERPATTKVITWAAGNGDRSENADYIYGKKRLREIDRRMRFLSKKIDRAVIVDPLTITSDRVQFGATVVVDDGEGERSYSIVGEDETDSDLGYISWKSPIGRALIGKECGDDVSVRTPKGEIEFEVCDIKYIDLNTGDKDVG